MTRETEAQRLSAIFASSGSTRDQLKQNFVLEYTQLAGYWAKRYRRLFEPYHTYNDLCQVAMMAIYKSIESYKSDELTFTSYASRCIRHAFTDLQRRMPKEEQLREEVVDEKEETDPTPYFAQVDMRDRLLVRLYYGWGCEAMSKRDISRTMNLSRREVDRSISRALETARNF